jgi:hypothetical protein
MISPPEEKDIFVAALILTTGFWAGQVSFLEPLQFLAIAQIYNYFDDYELPYNDGAIYT